MFTSVLGRYNNDEQTQKFNANEQYANLINQRGNTFSSTYVEENPNNILAQSETLAPDYKPPEVSIKNNIVIINSIDRDWYNYNEETPAKYLVKLGGSYTDQYSTVNNEYHNIVSFSIDKIILSNRICIESYTGNTSPRLNSNPYLTVSIDNINLSSYGTNKTLNNTMGIFTPLIPLPVELSNIAYLEFKNTSVQKKEYFPIPEGSISRLNLKITNPLGQLVTNLRDVLSIFSIFTNNANTAPFVQTDALIIQTNEYFTENEFVHNDLIILKNYKYHNPSYDESGMFNNFINRPAGHNIIKLSKSNASTILYDQIQIPIPATLSRNTGNLTIDAWYSSFIDKTFSNLAIADNGGKLINANTQSHLVVNIKTLEKNGNNMFLKDLI